MRITLVGSRHFGVTTFDMLRQHGVEIAGVVVADDVTGPYDVIARVEADSIDELGRLVVTHVQSIAGLTRTLTCPVVNL